MVQFATAAASIQTEVVKSINTPPQQDLSRMEAFGTNPYMPDAEGDQVIFTRATPPAMQKGIAPVWGSDERGEEVALVDYIIGRQWGNQRPIEIFEDKAIIEIKSITEEVAKYQRWVQLNRYKFLDDISLTALFGNTYTRVGLDVTSSPFPADDAYNVNISGSLTDDQLDKAVAKLFTNLQNTSLSLYAGYKVLVCSTTMYNQLRASRRNANFASEQTTRAYDRAALNIGQMEPYYIYEGGMGLIYVIPVPDFFFADYTPAGKTLGMLYDPTYLKLTRFKVSPLTLFKIEQHKNRKGNPWVISSSLSFGLSRVEPTAFVRIIASAPVL